MSVHPGKMYVLNKQKSHVCYYGVIRKICKRLPQKGFQNGLFPGPGMTGAQEPWKSVEQLLIKATLFAGADVI